MYLMPPNRMFFDFLKYFWLEKAQSGKGIEKKAAFLIHTKL